MRKRVTPAYEEKIKNMEEEIKTIEEISSEISGNFKDAESAKKDAMTSGFKWDDREQLFYGRYKSADEDNASYYSTGELQSLVLDSACRVMAQMPTGRFDGINDEDVSKVIGANLVYHEYILPNANTGGDFFTKQRQANIYSKVYGTMPAFIDYVVGKNYTGPDLVLVHPRRFIPQPGKYSIKDMDWCFVLSIVTKEWLEARAEANPQVWNPAVIKELNSSAVEQTLLTAEEKRGSSERKSIVLVNYFTKEGDWTLFEMISKKKIFSEQGYWPGIPMVEKLTIPVLDRYWGYCDFERGETPQKSIDALTRKYHKAVDKSIDPTTILDPESFVMSSVGLDNKFWFAKEGKVNDYKVLETAPQGLSTFPTAYNIMKANLMSMAASTDSSVASNLDVGFGKTPEALKMQGAREGARDSWDRYMQEKFLEDTANMMMAVADKRGMDKVKIPGIQSALQKIKRTFPEQDLNIFENGIVNKELLSDLNIRYKVDPGSTAKKDDAGEKMMAFLEKIIQNPEIMKELSNEGKKISWGKALKRLAIDQGIQDYDEIIIDANDPSSINGIGDEGGTITPNAEISPENMPINPAAIVQNLNKNQNQSVY